MIPFLRDLLERPGVARTVILIEPDSMSAPRQYEVRPGAALYVLVIAVVAVAALLVAAAVLTPLRGALVGPGAGELRATAERNAARAAALEDSLVAQVEQIDLLRGLITGEASGEVSAESSDSTSASGAPASAGPVPAVPADGGREALAAAQAPTRSGPESALRLVGAAETYLAGIRAPARLPLDGVVSRGFAPERGHLGLDIAAGVGTPVLAVGDGTVVLADWTQDGGLAVVVQHAGGVLSVYKHCSRILRQAGDRVRAREPVALSGNTGAVTSGPHLHVEVWRDGRAQDPAAFFSLR